MGDVDVGIGLMEAYDPVERLLQERAVALGVAGEGAVGQSGVYLVPLRGYLAALGGEVRLGEHLADVGDG